MNAIHLVRLALFAVGVLALGCDPDPTAVAPAAPDAAPQDMDAFNLPPAFDAARRPLSDGGITDAAILAGFLDPCRDNADCESEWCVPFEDRSVCSQPCLRADTCPDGWACRIVENTPPDVVSICIPPANRLCGVCTVDTDCPEGHCYTLDGEQICGLDCDDEQPCPGGYTCRAQNERNTCVPTTGSCSCSETNAGEARICTLTNAFGECLGRETCDPERGWIDCTAQMPAAEICNQVDDDCNGATDDILGLGEICEQTSEIDGEVKTCAGRLVCTLESPDPTCTATAPMAERCNFVDDDCDGATDETFPNRGEPCIVGEGLCRAVGVVECSEDGESAACTVTPGEPAAERCDGLDNDCDGQSDEAFPGLNELCYAGEGACRTAGALRCAPDGATAECTAVARAPMPEMCDALDNDCDGQVDEGFLELFSACTDGEGACARQGFVTCSDDGLQTVCSAEAAPASPERCNGVDDDCDGRTDEDFPGTNAPCQAGEGVCLSFGITACTPDGAAVACNASPGEPGDETCNGRDDDCDGQTDESFAGVGDPCFAGEGTCARPGVARCAPDGNQVVCDADPGVPSPETCNGLDDDCDGAFDETYADLNTACSAGRGLCRRGGVRVCSDDQQSTVCNASAAPAQADICNGLDDDCDGQTDEGFPSVGAVCSEGRGLCRKIGVNVCSNDGQSVTCGAQADAPLAERCNGLDDDCDGAVDEAFPTLDTPCEEGAGACLRRGVQRCAPDGRDVVCSAEAAAAQNERCNGIDDDCDGRTDEAFPQLGAICAVGEGRCRNTAVFVCDDAAEGVLCGATAGEAVAEQCNGLDDDCDGETDETYANLGAVCSVGDGACQRFGVQACAEDQAQTQCSASPGDPAAEVCNGIDDDCDGAEDENHPNVGTGCTVGVGLCRRAGILVCGDDPLDPLVCDAPAAPPADAEACDFQDDDCDGETDEDYVDDEGRYITTAHCGTCGTHCETLWDDDPAAFGVVPRCGITNGVAQCLFDCLPGRINGDGVPNNGCEVEVDADAIYVTPAENGGEDLDECGAFEAPCASITQGLGRAQTLGAPRVRASEGVYRENVTLIAGIDLLGGHHRIRWDRVPALFPSVIQGTIPEGLHAATVTAVEIDEDTTFDGFTVLGASPLGSGNAYGLYLRDVGPSLRIVGNRIFAGNGGRGADGDAGQDGLPGADGAPGGDGYNNPAADACQPLSPMNPGGQGGAQVCGALDIGGGDGGTAICPVFDAQEGNGARGNGARGGLGGDGAFSFEMVDLGNCIVGEAPDAFPGADGTSGPDGRGGLGAQRSLGSAEAHWLGRPGGAGLPGSAGGGGGGGGAAAGVDIDIVDDLGTLRARDIGSSGGGGGAGGCTGTGGIGGEAGGGSFGLFLTFSGAGPANANAFPTVVDNEISRGLGGRGGTGGRGGGGGEGGAGGEGGRRGPSVLLDFCALPGGAGGAGGRGGHGGGGGGGAGGVSYDLFIANDNGRAPDYLRDNLFPTAAAVETFGRGGDGGPSSNTLTGPGSRGVNGQSGHFESIP